jgi:hypothetical protein
MSSGHRNIDLRRCESRHVLIEQQATKYLIGEAATQHPQSFSLRVSTGCPRVEVVAPCTEPARLGHGDAMQRRVHLPIATTIQPKVRAPTPHRDRCCSIPAGEGRLRFEPRGACCFAHDLGCRERSTSRKCEQRGSGVTDEDGDLAFELVRPFGEISDRRQELSGDAGDGAVDWL